MKKALIAIAILLAINTGTFAQAHKSGPTKTKLKN